MMKKIIALGSAMVLSLAFSLTAFAAPSVDTETVATDGTVYSEETVQAYAATTTVTSATVQASVGAVSTETAAAADNLATAYVGSTAVVATIVDIVVPEGTGAATFTLTCPAVAAGMDVTILHQKADGNWEAITPDAVDNGSVTFTMTSYSPVAIVVNAAAPQTGDVAVYVAAMSMICLAGLCVSTKKAYN
ncbi:MAG: hypothetical protein E7285_09705 [Lachnospiraceae bacterium]|nr:hypothetical protein [Lachnospiraceae bacterium]